jgi:excisionase family DNA binding protein
MLSLKEAAAMLGCTESGLRKLVAKNEIRYFQHGHGGRIRFKAEWIDDFVEKFSSAPNSAPSEYVPKKRKTKTERDSTAEGDDDLGFNWELLEKLPP